MTYKLDFDYELRNGWTGTIYNISHETRLIYVGSIHSPISGRWIPCSWELDGRSWYGPQLDLPKEE